MQSVPPGVTVWLAALVAALIMLGVCVYGALIRQVATRGGRVSAREFGMPDLFLGSVFVTWFGALIANGFTATTAREVTTDDLLWGSMMFAAVVAVILFFLQARGISPVKQFGLDLMHPLSAVALALGLLLAAYPLVGLVGRLTEVALGAEAKQQEIVKYFLEASERSQGASVWITMALGVVLAPVAEEMIFRGYLYGVLKRYCGMLPAMLGSSAIFAAVHLNLSSLPALFVLALCLALAYEATGSLLVCMSMHALFNLSMFVLLLNVPPQPIPVPPSP